MNFEFWLSVNEDGDSAVSMKNAEDAKEGLAEYGGAAVRTAKFSVEMALPEIPEIHINVPDEPIDAVIDGRITTRTDIVADDAAELAAIDQILAVGSHEDEEELAA